MRYNNDHLYLNGSELQSFIQLCQDYQFDDETFYLILNLCKKHCISKDESFDSKTKFIICLDPDVPFHFFSKNVIGRDRRCKKNG